MTKQPWHQLPADEALAAQQTSSAGLSPAEGARRLASHGQNRLTPPSRRGPLMRFWRISFVSVLLAAGVVALFLWMLARGDSLDTARTVAVYALVVGEIAYLFNCRYLLAPLRNWQDFSRNPCVLLSIGVLAVIQTAFTYLPFIQKLFGVVALDAAAWGLIAGFGRPQGQR